MKYRLVVFDFDGTLADSFAWFVDVWNDAARRYRFRAVEPEEVEGMRGLSAREVMRRAGTPAWKVPFIVAHARRRRHRYAEQAALFPGVGALLRRLAEAGVEIAIVSSNSEANVRRVLGRENAGLVRHYECGASIFGKKASFRRVLRRSGVEPGATLCVGDEIRDAEAARAAGIPFGAVSWGYTTAEALGALGPAEQFATVAEIGEVVGGPGDPA